MVVSHNVQITCGLSLLVVYLLLPACTYKLQTHFGAKRGNGHCDIPRRYKLRVCIHNVFMSLLIMLSDSNDRSKKLTVYTYPYL